MDKPYRPEPVEFTPEVLERIRKETDQIVKDLKKHPTLNSGNPRRDIRRLEVMVTSLLKRVEDLEAKIDGICKDRKGTI